MICGCEQSHIDLSVYDQEFLLGVFLEFSSQITGYVLIGTLKRKKENLSFSLSMPTLDSFFFSFVFYVSHFNGSVEVLYFRFSLHVHNA